METNFNVGNFYKEKFEKGELFFVNGFDFQKDIPNHNSGTKRKRDFLGKSALLAFSKEKNVKIYITNEDFGENYKKISEEIYLVNIKKFLDFRHLIKNGTDLNLVQAFFTTNIDIKSVHLTNENLSEITQKPEFQNFLKTESGSKSISEETVLKWFQNSSEDTKKDFLEKIKSHFDFSQIPEKELLEEIKKRNLKIEDIQNLSLDFDIKKLEDTLKIWEEHKENADENFWQKTFEEKNWILSQIFSRPKVFIEGKSYCGGKTIGNDGGVEGDFLLKNELTENCAFIEIKTPKTDIVHQSKYRGKNDKEKNTIYAMSYDITGGISQVINQKESALVEHGKTTKLNNSKCILLIGSTESLTDGQKKSFEFFRNSNKDVEIITFDELFKRIENLKKILTKK